MRFSTSGFVMNQFLPSPGPEYPIRAVQKFFEICLDICSSRCTTGVIDTSAKWKKSSSRKDKYIFCSSSLSGVSSLILFPQVPSIFKYELVCSWSHLLAKLPTFVILNCIRFRSSTLHEAFLNHRAQRIAVCFAIILTAEWGLPEPSWIVQGSSPQVFFAFFCWFCSSTV